MLRRCHDMSTLQRLKILGFFRTRLLPCKQCSEGWDADSTVIAKSATIAVDRASFLRKQGYDRRSHLHAEDRGGGVKGNTSISSSTPRTDAARKADAGSVLVLG